MYFYANGLWYCITSITVFDTEKNQLRLRDFSIKNSHRRWLRAKFKTIWGVSYRMQHLGTWSKPNEKKNKIANVGVCCRVRIAHPKFVLYVRAALPKSHLQLLYVLFRYVGTKSGNGLSVGANLWKLKNYYVKHRSTFRNIWEREKSIETNLRLLQILLLIFVAFVVQHICWSFFFYFVFVCARRWWNILININ